MGHKFPSENLLHERDILLQSGNVEYIISKSDSEIETHLQHPPEEGVQFQLR